MPNVPKSTLLCRLQTRAPQRRLQIRAQGYSSRRETGHIHVGPRLQQIRALKRRPRTSYKGAKQECPSIVQMRAREAKIDDLAELLVS